MKVKKEIIEFFRNQKCETCPFKKECKKDILDKYNLDEYSEKESKNVEITPRESFMILDMVNYILDVMPNHDKYLYNTYSREELAKFGQRFGNLVI